MAFGKYDNKKCYFFTNFSTTTHTTNKNSTTKKITTKNTLIYQYNQGMGGVDLADQFLHTLLPFPHRRNKYTRVTFFAFFKVLFENCCVICRTKWRKKMTMREFYEIILENWIKKVSSKTKNINYEDELFFKKKKKHFPIYISQEKWGKDLIC